ncbi:YitT family protein [Nocardioides solisilvae]|uniref:YitT family protein n=1 Tax=Nocardioides solisilvae TaxID=1542435 RepID=UPI000D747D06|nr:YitT family protein [Nocardioides solisilvae]
MSHATLDPDTPRPVRDVTGAGDARRALLLRTGKHPVAAEAYKIVSIVLGAVVFAVGLEGFLIPNDFLDGGVVGVSIIAARFVDVPMGLFIGLLNLPFVVLSWVMVGRRSAVRTGIGIATLSAATIVFHHMEPLTDESWLALVCGGAMIAVGIGVALRHGGALDGSEVLATILASRTPFTVGQLILYVNLAIFAVAGFVISWESALLSAVLFYVVVKDLVDQIAHGESGARQVKVVTERHEEVARLVSSHTNRPVLLDRVQRYFPDTGLAEDVWVLTFATTRLEEVAIVEEIEAVDPAANITFSDIANLHGPMAESMTLQH